MVELHLYLGFFLTYYNKHAYTSSLNKVKINYEMSKVGGIFYTM